MKIIFRIAYHTVPGQSLWLRLDTPHEEIRWISMNWRNHRQWEAVVDLEDDGFRYSYQLRQESNELHLDEWGPLRQLRTDGRHLLLEDT